MGVKMGQKREGPRAPIGWEFGEDGILRRKKRRPPRAKKPAIGTPERRSAPTDKELDELWSQVVRERAGHECEQWKVAGRQCGEVMNAHHIFSRRHHRTRWDTENGMCLCKGHHMWTHANPMDSTAVIRSFIGDERHERIEALHNEPWKPTADDRRRIHAELSAELARLKAAA